jgi:hypothetical protein
VYSKSHIIVASLLTFIPAGAWADDNQQRPTNFYPNIHTVGVASTFGTSIPMAARDVAIFGNPSDPADPSNLDNKFSALISESASARFKVLPVAIDTQKVRQIAIENGAHSKELQTYFASLSDKNAVDAYIVALPTQYRFTGYNMDGVGIFHGSNFFDSGTMLHAYYEVQLIDAKTGNIIAWSRGTLNDAAPRVGGITTPCEDSIWPEKIDAITEEQKKAIGEELTVMVRITLPHALNRIGMPAAADIFADLPPESALCKPVQFPAR